MGEANAAGVRLLCVTVPLRLGTAALEALVDASREVPQLTIVFARIHREEAFIVTLCGGTIEELELRPETVDAMTLSVADYLWKYADG